jgi:HEAT repeat protein
MRALRGSPTPRAIRALIERLDGGGTELKCVAVEVLGEFGDPRARRPLIERLRDPSETLEVREMAVWALSEIGDDPSLEALIEALEDRCCEVRIEAARSLGAHRHRKAVRALLAALRGGEEIMRREAAAALGRIAAAETAAPLVEALGDRNPRVQEAVADALRELGATAVEPLAMALKSALDDTQEMTRWGVPGCRRWESACCHAAGVLHDACPALSSAEASTRMSALRAAASALPVWGRKARALRLVPLRLRVEMLRLLEVAIPVVEAAAARHRDLLTPTDQTPPAPDGPVDLRPSDPEADA